MMYQGVITGIISGIITAFILWVVAVFWNYKARRIIIIQARRIQYYLLSINNDITWGVEDRKEDYYDNLLIKLPFILQSADTAKESLSILNFCLFNRRAYIEKQLSEIISGVESLLIEVEGAEPKEEKLARLNNIKFNYQTSCSNILYYRAVFIEQLTKISTIQSALDKILLEEVGEETTQIYEELKKL